jgi:hypothetical protein
MPKLHESFDEFGEFFICYECATLETFAAVDREVKNIRQQRHKADPSG